MASAAGGPQAALVYLTLHYGHRSPRVHRLEPAWMARQRFTDDDPLGFSGWGSPTSDSAGRPTAARLVALRDGALAASVDLSPARDCGELVESASLSAIHVLIWPRHVSIKIFRGTEWISTSVYYVEEALDGKGTEAFEDISRVNSNVVAFPRMESDKSVTTHQFVGSFKDSEYFNFAPFKMDVGNQIMTTGDSLGKGAGGEVFQCHIFEHYRGALKICSKYHSRAEPLEVTILSMLNHENILQLYYAARDKSGIMHICSELCKRSLEQYINQKSKDQAVIDDKVFKEVIAGLSEVHRHKIVHRDIKPLNIMLDEKDSVRLIDFGLAAFQLGAAQSVPGQHCGTKLYMAPEMQKSLDHDQKADIYSTGIVLYAIYASKEVGARNIAPERKRVASIRKLKQKAYYSKNWKHCDNMEQWNKYTFAFGWRGDVSLLRRMVSLRSCNRPMASEILDMLVTKSSCGSAGQDLSSHIGTILPRLILVMDDEDEDTESIARKAAELALLVVDDEGVETLIHELLRRVNDSQGLISGSPEIKEQAAEGLGELIDVTSEKTLEEVVVPIAGPHIRILGDQFPWKVKSAILSTLTIIIAKGGLVVQPFLPQLQTTFVKCLQDSNRSVRTRAASALGKLSTLSIRVDPLVSDLLSMLQSGDDAVKESVLSALKGVVRHAGNSVSSAITSHGCALLKDLLQADADDVRSSAAKAIGTLSQYMDEIEAANLVQALLSMGTLPDWCTRHGVLLAFASISRHCPTKPCHSSSFQSVVDLLKDSLKDDKFPVREASTKTLGRLLCYQLQFQGSTLQLIQLLILALRDDSSEVRRRSLSCIKAAAKTSHSVLATHISILGPAVGDTLKDSSAPVRLAAERCIVHVFQLTEGADNVTTAQKYLVNMTGQEVRRLAKLPVESDGSESSDDDRRA